MENIKFNLLLLLCIIVPNSPTVTVTVCESAKQSKFYCKK